MPAEKSAFKSNLAKSRSGDLVEVSVVKNLPNPLLWREFDTS